MNIGLQIPKFLWEGSPENTGERLSEIVQAADASGFYSVWVMDHFFQLAMLGPADDPMLEAYTTLGHIAGQTKQVKLGTLVAGVFYREPALLLKAVTTLDVLSGGRAYFGVGAGWYEREARGLGFPWPSMRERFERLEETLQITKQVWADDRKPFSGKHYELAEPIVSPQPLSRPHPPIMVGGGGEKKTLKFVAQYGDACNIIITRGTEQLQHKLDVLQGHCDNLGRNYDEIEKTVLTVSQYGKGMQKPTDVLEYLAELEAMGVEHAIFILPGFEDPDVVRGFGDEVIARL